MSLLEKVYTEEHRIFRDSLKRYLEKNVVPYVEQWEEAGIVPRQAWKDFGDQGFLCTWLPEEYGGSGVGFEYSIIIIEEMERTNQMGFVAPLHSDVVVPYIYSFGNEEQKRRWLPGCASGDIITAVAMTEPEVASSDATNIQSSIVRDHDQYVINGHKWFSSGAPDSRCRLIIFMSKTDP